MSSTIYTKPLMCKHCSGNGEDPVCRKNTSGSFHVFADEAPTHAPGSASIGETDVISHVINLDCPPEKIDGRI